MTPQFWTKIVVTSLIILGDGVYASEINQRANAEAVSNSSIVQISQPDIPDDTKLKSQPVSTGVCSSPAKPHLRYQTLATVTYQVTKKQTYQRYHSRAPPPQKIIIT